MPRPALAAALGLLVAGCGAPPFRAGLPAAVAAAFDRADEVTLYSLKPEKHAAAGNEPSDPGAAKFYENPVLGQTVLTGPARAAVLAAFRRGVEDHDGSAAGCFIPRHGLRVKAGGRTVDLVICFQCRQVTVVVDGVPQSGLLVSQSPRAAFNRALRDAGVPLPPGAGE